MLSSFGTVALSPTLRASLSSASGAGFVHARILGSAAYVDVAPLEGVPQIAAVAHHHRWLAYPLRMGRSRPLSELDPRPTVKLIESSGHIRPIGQTHIGGVLVYGFEAVLNPAQVGGQDASPETITVYLTAAGEPIRITTLTHNGQATSPRTELTIEDLRPITKPVSVSPPRPSLTQTITYDQARSINLVP